MGIPINHVFSEVSERTYVSIASGEIFSLSFLINQLHFLLLTKVRMALFVNSLHSHFAWDTGNVAVLIAFPREFILNTLT